MKSYDIKLLMYLILVSFVLGGLHSWCDKVYSCSNIYQLWILKASKDRLQLLNLVIFKIGHIWFSKLQNIIKTSLD
jgi:hypothetical protein